MLDHLCGHIVHALGSGEVIGVRKKVAFERRGLRCQIGNETGISGRDFYEITGLPEARAFDCSGNIEQIEPFRDDDGVEVNVTASQTIMDLDCIGVVLKQIFTCFQRRAPMQRVP